ncbi:hypothetical protein Pmani_039362 [Petrolisthes manimaculis]|uniref:Uncharacterized protein n=1 Tax=Petrolisthes manimaculis TaxID=1843537 RepID=A0AAE1TLE6_9EUCA|nr:hypothetical protein Pmani_039362 [Petrolisthes manimaculis]
MVRGKMGEDREDSEGKKEWGMRGKVDEKEDVEVKEKEDGYRGRGEGMEEEEEEEEGEELGEQEGEGKEMDGGREGFGEQGREMWGWGGGGEKGVQSLKENAGSIPRLS